MNIATIIEEEAPCPFPSPDAPSMKIGTITRITAAMSAVAITPIDLGDDDLGCILELTSALRRERPRESPGARCWPCSGAEVDVAIETDLKKQKIEQHESERQQNGACCRPPSAG
jgi:hypothetical protein